MPSNHETLPILDVNAEWFKQYLSSIDLVEKRARAIALHMPAAREFAMPTVSMTTLAKGLGRVSIFYSIMDHQRSIGIEPDTQVFAGINGISLVQNGSLISEANPDADEDTLNASFFATQVPHWKDVLADAKYSPFTYIHKARQRNKNPYPAIVGFNLTELFPTYSAGPENIQWSPHAGHTTESTIRSIYYFNQMFPNQMLRR